MSNVEAINYRKSGLLLAFILAFVYIVLLVRGKNQFAVLITAMVVALCASFDAWPLRKVIVLLTLIGKVMSRFTNPVAFGLIYIVAVIPTALILKLFGAHLLNLRFDRKCSTYWVARSSGSTWTESFRNQF